MARLANPPPENNAEAAMAAMALRRQIDTYFSESEIRGLALDLGINPEDLPDQDKRTLVQSLVQAAEHRGRVWDLVTLCERQRPNAAWPKKSATGPLTAVDWE